MKKEKTKYDIFISHASKDKIDYVDELVEEIKKVGLTVFYDTESIIWGDCNSKKINEGLSNCKLAVVVISKNYFGRKWTERELYTLLLRQNSEGRKLIMPILHGITKKQLLDHYPELEDIQFKYSKSCSRAEMARILKQEIDKIK